MEKIGYFHILIVVILLPGCKRNAPAEEKPVPYRVIEPTTNMIGPVDTPAIAKPEKKDSIYGDTVWAYSYGTLMWHDTVSLDDFLVYLSVKVDTTDFIVDTVRSRKGQRIVIGYNHHYQLSFWKQNKPWFKVRFNKKKQLAALLEGTEFWMESNLDVFRNMIYNSRYDKFVVEFDINPRFNYGSVYYLVINTSGELEYIGTSNSWGGGGPDGSSFISADEEVYITCYEVYNFAKKTAIGIEEYAMLSENRETGTSSFQYKQLHGLRKLDANTFLVVFGRYHGIPEFNGLILNTDTTVLKRFRYYGLMEEMDALLLFSEKPEVNKYFLYDSEREVLICLAGKDSITMHEFYVKDMKPLSRDSLPGDQFILLDFEAFASYRFYIDSAQKEIYHSVGNGNIEFK
jgi:hypothetical protein